FMFLFFVCFGRFFLSFLSVFFFFNATATTEIYTLSLHDALPISSWRCSAPGSRRCDSPLRRRRRCRPCRALSCRARARRCRWPEDRKSTRLNSSHVKISYAVFCLKKKKKTTTT